MMTKRMTSVTLTMIITTACDDFYDDDCDEGSFNADDQISSCIDTVVNTANGSCDQHGNNCGLQLGFRYVDVVKKPLAAKHRRAEPELMLSCLEALSYDRGCKGIVLQVALIGSITSTTDALQGQQ